MNATMRDAGATAWAVGWTRYWRGAYIEVGTPEREGWEAARTAERNGVQNGLGKPLEAAPQAGR